MLHNTHPTSIIGMSLSLWMRPLIILLFACSTPHYTLLDKGIKYWKFTWITIIYLDDTNDAENPGQSYVYLYSLEFQQKINDWICRLAVYTCIACVLTNNVILLGLPNTHRNLISQLLTSIISTVQTGIWVILRIATLGWWEWDVGSLYNRFFNSTLAKWKTCSSHFIWINAETCCDN